MLHCLHHCCNCRDCSNALAYEGKEDCVFNWSNLFLITYELGFSYADNMCISRLPFSQHFKVLYNAHSHSGNVKLLMTRPTHRCSSCNLTVAGEPQHVSRQTGLYCDNSIGQYACSKDMITDCVIKCLWSDSPVCAEAQSQAPTQF